MTITAVRSLAYPESHTGRDLRIDFLRGFIMIYLIIVHFEYYSALGLFAWERLALISSAEGFVFLSGVVVGMVYRKRIQRVGLYEASLSLWARAFKLYKANVAVILSIALLGLVPFIDTFEVTHWRNLWSGETFSVFPPADTSFLEYLWLVFTLKVSPHQYQIIGLYVVLLALAPGALYLLARGRIALLLLLSWVLYLGNFFLAWKITGARYELGFPTLTWQLLFFNGLVVGYHRKVVLGYLSDKKSRWLVIASVVVAMLLLLFANHKENGLFWPWGRLDYISVDLYSNLYMTLFQKTNLGIGRLLNNVVLFIIAYYLLSQYWFYFEKVFGWLMIPLGQNSLYVFTVHIYFLLLLSNTPFPGMESFLVNTGMHLFVIVSIWWMVKREVLFGIVPR